MVPDLLISEHFASVPEHIGVPYYRDLIRLTSGDVLFAPGTEKQQCFFWIIEGQIKLRWQSPHNSADVIEVFGSGDFFGFGFLDHHVYGATAVNNALVQSISSVAAQHIAKIDPALKEREALETQREFIHRRETLIASASQTLPRRLAAFLAFISRFNANEGRDSMIITDDIKCHVVSEYLSADIEELSAALKQLSDLGAVEVAPPAGLRIRDLDFLEYIAGSSDKVLDH